MVPPAIHHPPPPPSPLRVSGSCLSAIATELPSIRGFFPLAGKPSSLDPPRINTQPCLSLFISANRIDRLSGIDPQHLQFSSMEKTLRATELVERKVEKHRSRMPTRWTVLDEDEAAITGAGFRNCLRWPGCPPPRGLLELMATILHSTSLARISTDTNGVSLGAGIGTRRGRRREFPEERRGTEFPAQCRRNRGFRGGVDLHATRGVSSRFGERDVYDAVFIR